jgi:hypothetical protein
LLQVFSELGQDLLLERGFVHGERPASGSSEGGLIMGRWPSAA